jgi:hypothetical protein
VPAQSSPAPLPPKVRFRIRLQTPIDTETAATGDPVVGVVRTTIKDKQNGIIVHAGDRVHGRIARIEQYFSPRREWNITIAFETIERGVGDHGIDQGIEQPVTLVPADAGDHPAAGGYFIFHDPGALADRTFEIDCETR